MGESTRPQGVTNNVHHRVHGLVTRCASLCLFPGAKFAPSECYYPELRAFDALRRGQVRRIRSDALLSNLAHYGC